MAKREISGERKTMYFIGNAISIVGMLLFLSTFITFLSPDKFLNNSSSMGGIMARPFIGILLLIAGNGLRTLAARGVAGSGLILDPKKAREDLSPWSSMAGGIINDALDETDIGKGKETIKIRCQSCSELNEEDARFCKQCGKAI